MVKNRLIRPLLPVALFGLVISLGAPPAMAAQAPEAAAALPVTIDAAEHAGAVSPPATAATAAVANPAAATTVPSGGTTPVPGTPDTVYSGLTEDAPAATAPALRAGERVAGVDVAVREAVAEDGTVPVIVRLHDQVDMARLQDAAAAAARQATAAAGRELQGSLSTVGRHAWEAGRAARGQLVVDTLQHTAAGSQPAVQQLLTEHDATDITEYWIFNGLAATVDAAAVDALAAHPAVASVSVDETIVLDVPDFEPGEPQLPIWSLERVNATDAWGEYGIRGEGVVVGVLDTGVDGSHPALAASWRGQTDPETSWYVGTNENYPEPGDGNGHGTHVTGSIVGAPPGEVTGVAPDAQWIAAKVFTDFGNTTDSILHSSLQWMLAPGGDPAAAPHVVNNSWGAPDATRTVFWEDFEALVAAGIVPVVSNGNAGPGTGSVGSPASYPHVIGVGATDVEDRIASFSSRGPAVWDGVEHAKPEVSAPGHAVYSSLPGGGYGLASGTSMAAPHVAGVVALLLSAAPDLSVDQVAQVLQHSARSSGHMQALPQAYGAGIVDAHAAITYAVHSGTVAGNVTSNGDPVAATITAADTRTTADADNGAFVLRLPAGSHEVTIEAYGYATVTHPVQVSTGATLTLDVDLTAVDAHPVTGSVTGPDGPVPGARVTVVDTPVAPVRAGEGGAFHLQVAQGTYRVRVAAGGHEPVSTDLVVGDGPAELAVTLPTAAQPSQPQWAQYQNNPARTGQSGDDLAADTLEELWSASAGGQLSFTSPVVADGRVFVSVDNGTLVALDLDSGERLWTFTGSSTMRGAPAVANGMVYAGGGVDGGIHALDAATGALRWTVPTPGQRTIYTAPVVQDGVLYATTGFTPDRSDSVLALDAATGDRLWAVDIGARVFFGPAVDDGIVVAGSAEENHLVALDAATGDQRWVLQRDLDEFIAGPSIADGTVYATTSVPPTTSAPGWEGSLLAVDAATGELRWEVATHGDGQGTTPAVHGDLVIAGSHGQSMVAAYDRQTGEPRWHYGLPVNGAISHSVLVSGDGYVIAGSQLDQRVFALDAATGELVWQRDTGSNVLSAAAYADGRLVTAASNGTLRAYHPTGGVAGTVTGPDGPVAATVRVVEVDRQVSADPDSGAFEVIGLTPGTYTLEVFHYGMTTETRTVAVRVAQTTQVDVTLDAVGYGQVTGTVTDQDGQPVPEVSVSLSPAPLDPIVTDEAGAFTFPQVAAGTYELVAQISGYGRGVAQVSVTAGDTTQVQVPLPRLEVAVVSDYQAQITEALQEAGWLVDRVTFDQIVGNLDRYRAVVLAGEADDRADADLDRLTQIVAEADQAGTSLVVLDQWASSYGTLHALSRATGDPAVVEHSHTNQGAVWLQDVVDHPITASLSEARVPVLTSGSDHGWFADYSGYVLAQLGTDRSGVLGAGIGYQRRSFDNNHVLLPVHASSPWSGPESTWQPVMRQLLSDAVTHAADAAYGAVDGHVTDADGAAVRATVEVVGGIEHLTTGDDGHYRTLLEPGEHLLRFHAVGSQPVEQTVTVTAGEVHVHDVHLPRSPLGTVTGQVTSQGGNDPVGNVTVTVGQLAPVTTGADGRYVVTDVPAGTYDVTFAATGWEPTLVDQVAVRNGEVTTVDVALARTPAVVVVGDYNNGLTELLEGHSIPVTQAGWEVVDDLDDVEVVILQNPSNVGEAEFLAALAAFDDADVSVIFPADGWATRTRGVDLLSRHTGNPPSYTRLGGVSGPEIFLHNLVDHPLFDGVSDSDPLRLLNATSEAAYFPSYQGITLAEVGEVGGPAGIGIAYDVRTPDSVHLLLSGLAATFRNNPPTSWTEDAEQILLNAVRWAASPQQSGLSGVVTDADGNGLAHVQVQVTDGHWHTITDADGAFELGVPPGEHTLRYQAFGYTTVEQEFSVAAGQVADASAQLSVDDVGSISGVVTSGDGGALAGVRVQLRDTPREVVTDADGAYHIDLVESGSYELELEIDAHVRTLVPVTVASGQTAHTDVVLRPSPRVGIIDDSTYSNSRDRGKEFLADWGYQAEDVEFDSLAELGGFDLIVANISSPSYSLSVEQLRAFEEEVNRAGVPVLWLAQHQRGGIELLHELDGDPAVIGEGYNDGAVTAQVVEPHPLVAGLPEEFSLMVDGGRYTFFDEFDGTTVARLATGDGGEVGSSIAYRGRTTGTVDVLLSTLSVTTWGAPSTRQSPALHWTPQAERVLVNALDWALDAQDIGAEVRGTVRSNAGGTLASVVEVQQTGRVYQGRAGDGTFLVPLQPGTWTLSVSAFGHQPQPVEVTVGTGDAVSEVITLAADPSGSIAGTVTGPDGEPVADAQVQLLDTPLSVRTNAEGTYRVTNVPEGQWRMRVTGDGFRAVQQSVTVAAGQTTQVDVQLPATAAIAIVDTTGSSTHGTAVARLLEADGYEVTLQPRNDLAQLPVEDYELIIFNSSLLASHQEAFGQIVDAAADAGVSTIYPSQHGSGYALPRLAQYRDDPQQIDWGFVTMGVDYVPSAPHPIFAGFPVGEPIELLTNTSGNLNQQYGTFDGYSGETIARVHSRADGDDLGGGVGYRFSSPTSVELLLGSLAASNYGWPQDRWTDDARQIYLNAVAWALDATQAQLEGTITGEGEPVAGATVTAVEAGVTDVTGADGSYALGLAAGTYTVEVSAFGYATARESVQLPDSGTVTLDVDLARLPRGSIAGTVTSTAGGPVAGAELDATGPLPWQATSGDDGGYLVDDLIEGEYQVTVTADGFLTGTGTVTVTADEQATLDVVLQPTDTGVLGDVDGTLSQFLRDHGVAAAELPWRSDLELDGYRVLVVNGGDPDKETFQAVLAAADDAEVSLVFTGTWAVDRGGIRLLERYTDRVEVGPHGYGDGPVQLTGFTPVNCPAQLTDCPPVHPLFAGLGDEPVTLITEGGYYSVLADYRGGYAPAQLAQLRVEQEDAEPLTGLAVATDWRTAGSVEVLLSASAVTEAVGPGKGWTAEAGRLLLNAVQWAGDAELAAPPAPSLSPVAPVVADDTGAVTGTAQWPSQVTVYRDDEPLATVDTAEDGTWSAEVPLVVGENTLTAVATNLAGDSPASTPVSISRWEATWQVTGRWVVQLSLVGPPPLVRPADEATLVVRDADGEVVAREQMRWTPLAYLQQLRGLPPGQYQLSAQLQVDGHTVVVDGPMIR